MDQPETPRPAREGPDRPRVVALHLAPGRRLPMREVAEAYAASGHGLRGDRYEDARHRHLTLQSASQLQEAAERLGAPIAPATTRRNVTLSHGEVPTTPGTRLVLGELDLEVVRVAAPCRILDDSVGPGAAEALRRRAGVVVRVLAGGRLRLGDELRLP